MSLRRRAHADNAYRILLTNHVQQVPCALVVEELGIMDSSHCCTNFVYRATPSRGLPVGGFAPFASEAHAVIEFSRTD